MAIYDRESGKIVVRVVYDGPGSAGKTTNIRALCEHYSARRRSEVYTPEEQAGRTMFFDWLVVEAGLVAGHGLRCQVVTVPGQLVLAQRRARLLRSADVVVFVCESTTAGVTRVKRGFAQLQRFMKREGLTGITVVVQANKQDLPDALGPTQIAEVLGLHPSIQVVPARAKDGIGVRETVLLAIRAAAARAQRAVVAHGIDSLAAPVIGGAELLRAMTDEDAGEWNVAGFEDDEVAVPSDPTPRPAVKATPTMTTPLPTPIDSLSWPRPPRASDEIASGAIWPASIGRDLLAVAAAFPATPRRDLALRLGSRAPSSVIYQAGDWAFVTSPARRFPDADSGRAALLALVRAKIDLGTLLAPRSAVFLARDPATSNLWLWTLAPWLTTLRTRMDEAAASRDERALGLALTDFVSALSATQLDASEPRGLDLDPACFAVSDGRVSYFHEHAETTPPAVGFAALGPAFLARVEEYQQFAAAIATYLDAIAAQLARSPRRHEVLPSIESFQTRSEAGVAARVRLLGSLGRRSAPLPPTAPPASSTIIPVPPPRRAPPRTPAESPALAARSPTPFPAPMPMPMPMPPRSAPAAMRTPPYSTPPVGIAAPSPGNGAAHRNPTPHTSEIPMLDPTKIPTVIPASAPPRGAAPASGLTSPTALTAMADVPSSFLWPPTARDTLRRLVSHAVPRPGDERDGLASHEVDGWSLRTPLHRSFRDGVQGRAELLRLGRAHSALGALASSHTFLVLAPGGASGQLWIWRVTHSAPSLRTLLDGARERRDPVAMAHVLVRYAHAVVEGLTLARRGRTIDLAPAAFTVEDDLTVYSGDDGVAGRVIQAAGQVMLGLLDDLEGFPTAVADYLATCERLLARRLSRPDVDALELRRAFSSASLRSRVGNEARARLTAFLDAAWLG